MRHSGRSHGTATLDNLQSASAAAGQSLTTNSHAPPRSYYETFSYHPFLGWEKCLPTPQSRPFSSPTSAPTTTALPDFSSRDHVDHGRDLDQHTGPSHHHIHPTVLLHQSTEPGRRCCRARSVLQWRQHSLRHCLLAASNSRCRHLATGPLDMGRVFARSGVPQRTDASMFLRWFLEHRRLPVLLSSRAVRDSHRVLSLVS